MPPPDLSSIPPALRYGIDRLEARGTRVFGWGWIAHPSRTIETIALRVSGEGWQRVLQASAGRTRDDVEKAFPDLAGAKFSGFMVTGYVERPPLRNLMLEVAYAGGGEDAIDVTASLHVADARKRKWREVRWIAAAVWRRLRHGDVRGIVRRARSQNYSAPSLDDFGVVRTLMPRIPAGQRVTIVFDHNMGGGANLYRRNGIAERVASGGAVVLCTYNLPTLDYRLTVHAKDVPDEPFRVSSFLALEPLFERLAVAEIFVNRAGLCPRRECGAECFGPAPRQVSPRARRWKSFHPRAANAWASPRGH